MIVTITMNPAVDKTAAVEKIELRALNRLGAVVRDVGGKGINVSKTIAALGGSSTATGFLAGDTGAAIARELAALPGVTPDFVTIEGETRTNLKLVEPGGALTELNEPGPEITAGAMAQLQAKLGQLAGPDTLFVLAGSAGKNAPPTACRSLIEAAHAGGARVFLDADGEQLAEGLAAKPEIIKPNAFELCRLFGRDEPPAGRFEELAAMARELNARGIGLVCVSLGSEGALFVREGRVLRAPGLRVTCRSSVGAGDAMVAAIAYGLDAGLPQADCIRLAMAAGAAACTTVGTKPPPAETVRALEQQVQLLPLA